MSAALQISGMWQANQPSGWHVVKAPEPVGPATLAPRSEASLAFYRKRTEKLLRKYLYASMLVGRTPSLLEGFESRGWSSHSNTHTFEDSVILVLDMEKCLRRLNRLDRDLLSRIVLQEYSLAETADILRVSLRRITVRFGLAVDHLTKTLLDVGLLIIPH